MQTDSIEVRRTARRFALFVYTLAATALLVSLLVACGGSGADAGISDAATPLKRIVYQRSVTQANGIGQADLYAVNEDGTGDVALTTGPGDKTLMVGSDRSATRVGDRLLYYIERGTSPSGSVRDYYSVRVDGTAATLLAKDKSASGAIVVGDRVLIGAANELLSMKADGSAAVSLATGAWGLVGSQQGRVLYVALVNGSGHLFSVRTDGSGQVELMSDFYAQSQDFDPIDRRRRVNMTAGGDMLLSGHSGTGKDLYITNSDATGLVFLGSTRSGFGLWGSPNDRTAEYDVLPVGDRVVYIGKDNSLFSVKLDGTSTVTLAPGAGLLQMTIVGAVGNKVLYRSARNPFPDLYAIDVDGGSPRFLGNGDLSAAIESQADGRALVVGVSSNPFDLVAINVDGPTGGAILANGVHPALTGGGPDPSVTLRAMAVFDKRVVFRRANGAVLNTYSTNADGTGLTTLVGGSDPSDPEAISRECLVFRRVVNEQSDLYSVLLDGTGLATLANSTADERFGIFVGSKVVYTRLVADHRDLYIVNGDGSEGRVLSSNADDKQPVAVF